MVFEQELCQEATHPGPLVVVRWVPVLEVAFLQGGVPEEERLTEDGTNGLGARQFLWGQHSGQVVVDLSQGGTIETMLVQVHFNGSQYFWTPTLNHTASSSLTLLVTGLHPGQE